MKSLVSKVVKRDGSLVGFDQGKITAAIDKAFRATGEKDGRNARKLSDSVVKILNRRFGRKKSPDVEEIQDAVEKVLIDNDYARVAKAYILYRQKRAEIRLEKMRILEKETVDDVDKRFDVNALRVLKARYLRKDETGKLLETPKELFTRVAVHVALPDLLYDGRVFDKSGSSAPHGREEFDEKEHEGKASIGKYSLNRYHLGALKKLYDRLDNEKKMKLGWGAFFGMVRKGEFGLYEKSIDRYFDLMVSKRFLPNTPAIANFGNPLGQGSACFALDIEDSIESIMDTLKKAATIFKAGGGVGYNFSKLRPEGDFVKSTHGIASGPVSFIQLFDAMTEVIKQGSIRRGANMGILNCVGGSTLINTVEGKIPIKDLENKKAHVYCYDKNANKVKIREAFAYKTRKNAEVWKVTFDNDDFLIVTPDHRIMLSDGTYRSVKDSKSGDSAMAFYKILDEKGYVRIGATGQTNAILEHIAVAEMKLGRYPRTSLKRRPDNEDIHHMDDDRTNNHPDNLKILTSSEHAKLHSQNLKRYQKIIADKRRGKRLEDVYDKEIVRKWKEKMSRARKSRSPWNKDVDTKVYISHYKNGFKNQFSNHKIKKIEFYGHEDVYDLTVPGLHNFAAENIFIHNCNHPDIEKFITAKAGNKALRNFNISVLVFPDFWECYKKGKPYPLVNPRSHQIVKHVDPMELFDRMCYQAWESAEPGMIFFDHINKHNPFLKGLGPIVTTNPCGEATLYPKESCNLGSVNVWVFAKDKSGGKKVFDWDGLKETVAVATRFLDNVMDVNKYPLPEIEEMTLNTRKIGLGMMGVADLLFELKLPYNSEDGRKFMEKLMEFINYHSKLESVRLAKERGSLPFLDKTFYPEGKLPFAAFYDRKSWRLDWNKISDGVKEHGIRNGFTTLIAPTGSISMIAGCSSGIEPLFSLVFEKNVKVGSFYYIDPVFEEAMRNEGLYDEELIKQISDNKGMIQDIKYLPEKFKRVFVTAMDVKPEDHVKALAAFQRWVDSSISKTNNMPASSTVEDVKAIYLLAYNLGCKDITVYRDTSLKQQVLSVPKREGAGENSEGVQITARKDSNSILRKCPNDSRALVFKEGCWSCPECGYGYCAVA